MNIMQFIASMLVLIFIALAWRFLLPLCGIAVSLLLWFLLFAFIKGVIEGAREIAKNETS